MAKAYCPEARVTKQRPFEQAPSQVFPQLPQFAGSMVVFTHRPAHKFITEQHTPSAQTSCASDIASARVAPSASEVGRVASGIASGPVEASEFASVEP
jgi:hypothetical protein